MSEYQCTCKGWGYGSYHSPENKHCPLYDTYKDPAATRLDQGANPMSEQERSSEWLYEVRGSFIYDLASEKQLHVTEAVERLNHSAKLAATWAAKAGLAQGKLDKAESRISALETEVERYRPALEFIANSLTIWARRKGYIAAIRNAAIDALTEFVAETEEASDG